MPNYKTFQDNPDALLVKIYGNDSTETAQPLLTTASGILNVTGDIAVSGPIEVSGSVAVSGPVEISGSVAVSGPVEISGIVALSGHSIVDSGPVTTDINVALVGSGALSGGSYDVLSYTSWTLAVQYSGASGDQVHVILEKSAFSGTIASGGDYVFDSSGTFSAGNWVFLTAGITPRYARLYYIDTGESSGALLSYFQAQN